MRSDAKQTADAAQLALARKLPASAVLCFFPLPRMISSRSLYVSFYGWTGLLSDAGVFRLLTKLLPPTG